MFQKRAYDESMLKQMVSSEKLELIEDKARYDGTDDNPPPDQTTLTTTEEEIRNSCRDLRARAKEDAENELANQKSIRYGLTKGCEDKIQQIKNRLSNDIHLLKVTRKPHILNAINTRIDNYKDMRCFKNKHHITHRATYTENRFWAAAILVTLLVIESLLNANMLAKTNIYGIIGGWAEAIFISLANIFFGFFAGIIPTRFSFYRPNFAKYSARIGLGGSIAVIIFFNFMFAHYRLVGTPDVSDILTAAWSSASRQPFAIFWDIKSFSLFIVGVTFSGLAAWKGYDWDDRYPFYGRIHRTWSKSKQNIIKEQNAIINEGIRLAKEAQDALLKLTRKAQTVAADYVDSVNDSKAAISRYDDIRKRIESAYSHLINVYRETNSNVRDSNDPPYFRLPATLPEEEAMIDRDLGQAEQEAGDLEAFSVELKGKINKAINDVMEQEQTIVNELEAFFEELENEAADGRKSATLEAEETDE